MSTIDPNILTADRKQLDLELENLRSKVELLERRAEIQHFGKLETLGLGNNFTLTDLARAMPFNSVFRMDVYAGVHSQVELPKNFSGVRMSGQLIATKHGDASKCYFYWQNELYSAHAMYNEGANPVKPMFDWIFSREYFAVPITAAEYSNSLANVSGTGLYYFPGAEAAAFSDSPIPEGSFLRVMSQTNDGAPTSRSFIQEVTRNYATALEIYRRQVSGGIAGEWLRMEDK